MEATAPPANRINRKNYDLIKVAALFVAAKFLLTTILLLKSGLLASPPEVGDGHDYDMIAFSLVQGHGFGYHWSDPDWRAPYEQDNKNGQYSSLLTRTGPPTSTAYRPPGFPLLLAAIYKVFGRDFQLVRLLNSAALALALGIAILMAGKLVGKTCAILTGCVGLLDQASTTWSLAILAEPASVLLVALMIYILTSHPDSPETTSSKKAVLIGGLMGFLILLRNPFIFWVPIALAGLLLGWTNNKQKLRNATLFLLAIGLILSPWTIRNARLLGAFVPFGTQSGPNLVFDYSDPMITAQGRNDGTIPQGALQSYQEHIKNKPPLTGIHAEQQVNKFYTSVAISWIRANPEKIPNLLWLKLSSLWWRHASSASKILILLAGIGLIILLWGNKPKWPILIPIIGTSFCAVITQNLGGDRLLLPVLPVLWILAGVALSKIKLMKFIISG